MHILLIEDNPMLCRILVRHIKKAGYTLDYTCNGLEGLPHIHAYLYDIIIIDCLLPIINIIDVLKQIRCQGNTTPMMVTSTSTDVTDRIKVLDAGADDYLTKPFSIDEFLARLRALKRRSFNLQDSSLLSYGDLTYDYTSHILTGPITQCTLTPKEALLLELFLENPHITFNRSIIFARIWGMDTCIEECNLDNYIRFIRRRLTTVGSHVSLKTIRNIGYVLESSNTG